MPRNVNDFFSLVNKESRFWLPAVLNEIAKIPSSLCRGDNCSIFLLWGEGAARRLHLAATTNTERLSELFDPHVSYSVAPEKLRLAATIWMNDRHISPDASLTGWVAAFKCALMCRDLHNSEELDRMTQEPDRPRPIWSEKSRGPQDHDETIPRPFLCVPMMNGDRAVGAIRVATTTRHPHVFDETNRDRLQEFANSLAGFLVGCGALERENLNHAFRIWGAGNVDEIGSRITEAVPALFDVECCSFFLRDHSGRFVLRTASARPSTERFRRFLTQNRENLYYRAGDGSKTALCIDRQVPVVLIRQADGAWRVDGPTEAGPAENALPQQSGGKHINGDSDDKRPEITCEFLHEHTRSILLVPVRDHLSTELPAGVLRILSTSEIQNPQAVVTDMLSFAEDLAGVIGLAWRDDQKRRARDELVTVMSRKSLKEDEKIATAARIACDAVDAAAVTIFIREVRNGRQLLKTKPEYTVLSDQYQSEYPAQETISHHQRFKRASPEYDITVRGGPGRTVWVWEHGKTLNLKSLGDEAELKRFEVRQNLDRGPCEILEAGPFLAVPISAGPNVDGVVRVEGVIRAVRRNRDAHGSFSPAHEEILATCGNMLAVLLAASKFKAAVSFCTRAPVDNTKSAFDVVKGWIELAGGVALWIEDRAEGNPMQKFADICSKADIGIVIATVDTQELVSDAVESENQHMWGMRLQNKRILLEMDGVRYRRPELNEGSVTIRYPRQPMGIYAAEGRFHAAVDELLERRKA